MSTSASNLFLNTLPAAVRSALLEASIEVELPIRKSLYEAGHLSKFAYFLHSGSASVARGFENGQTIDVGIIGREGAIGVHHLLGTGEVSTRCFMQIAGSGLRVPLDDFRALFAKFPELRTRVLEFLQFQTTALYLVAACNALHEAKGRLAKWLLMIQDITSLDTLPLTQDSLAEMLGIRRTTVAIQAGSLQAAKIIAYSRGKIQIIDRPGLQDAACECYPIFHRTLMALYTQSIATQNDENWVLPSSRTA